MRLATVLCALASLSDTLRSAAALATPTAQEKDIPYEGTRTPKRRIPPSHRLHERHTPENLEAWVRREPADSRAILPIRIGLKQSNLDTGHNLLMDISDPKSPNYGKHLTLEKVTSLFAPTDTSVDKVRSWLISAGVNETRLSQSVNKQWIQFDATVDEAERLLLTDYYVFEHVEAGVRNIACSEYHVPHKVAEHIDYITPGIRLISAGNLNGAGLNRKKVRRRNKRRQQPETRHQNSHSNKRQQLESDIAHSQIEEYDEKWFKIMGPCTYEVTPDCVRNQYHIPNGTKAFPGNELGVFQSLDQHYNQWDLDMYWKYTAPYIPKGTHPTLRSINGALGPAAEISSAGEEADLDFQVAIPLVFPQTTVLWQTDDEWYQKDQMRAETKYTGFFNTLFDAIDGSYCSLNVYGYSGNCDTDDCRDPVYPNLADSPEEAYKGPLMCGAYEPTNVISISYSGFEHALPKNYLRRQCVEIMKLALQGVTVVESSGDYGVGGRRSDPKEGCLGPDRDVYSPRLMSNCPYVLSVGATALVSRDGGGGNGSRWGDGGDFREDKERRGRGGGGGGSHGRRPTESQFAERAPTSFASGGGFSNIYSTPRWQKRHVDGYLRRANISHLGYDGDGGGSSNSSKERRGRLFNRAGRGYPDVAAIGDNYRVITGGYSQRMGGTSVAVPIWASVLTLLNEERLAVGKSTIGFVHQVFYQHPEVFTDITTGSNPGCGGAGFQVKEGWDPVTGLGTPIYPKLLELFLRLP
ncbi:Pro-kumamolisin, activation domain-containing protein [Apodospora peruviana]|uniref:Pro-kumamolisin, activation domain-containing protein n=1 Tax=Apodospora peruviana TaxID=516989 RepID=A0AAE0M7S2_9PEZI|nr:Pro-kumamolisin, activation domain-containing protein [Apodospora peruviana]